MEPKKITKDFILESIEKEAKIYARKNELYEQVKKINEELKNLNEHSPLASFGFKVDGDNSQKNPSGFVNPPNISYIAQLEKEMNSETINEENLLEIEKLRSENESLKSEIENLKGGK